MATSTIDSRIAEAASDISRRRLILRGAIVAVAALIAAMLALLPNPARAAGSPVVINMKDKEPFYTPEKITIKAGETVRWVNGGETMHSVSTDSANAQNAKDTSKPKNAPTFDSGFIPPGGNYSYTFTVPGTYRYFCLPHEKAGMVGVIVVKK